MSTVPYIAIIQTWENYAFFNDRINKENMAFMQACITK